MIKIKRIILKYIEGQYTILKIQNVEGFFPKQVLNQQQVSDLHNSDIEVILK